jgi:hypothetical protein
MNQTDLIYFFDFLKREREISIMLILYTTYFELINIVEV